MSVILVAAVVWVPCRLQDVPYGEATACWPDHAELIGYTMIRAAVDGFLEIVPYCRPVKNVSALCKLTLATVEVE